ncbi:hypothetical protein Bbelb_188760 [Branchiostoma belcheri]|nr:hypothetical protein Bbelb_188760 [Branchiostoma belcheri]
MAGQLGRVAFVLKTTTTTSLAVTVRSLRWLLTDAVVRTPDLEKTRPDDLKTNISSEDSCLNLTREDWTRPDDSRTQEEYQTGLEKTRWFEDTRNIRCVLRVGSSPDVPVLTGRNL